MRLETIDCTSTKFPQQHTPFNKNGLLLVAALVVLDKFACALYFTPIPTVTIQRIPMNLGRRQISIVRQQLVLPEKCAASKYRILSFVVYFVARPPIPSASSNLRVQAWGTSSGSETSCKIRRFRCRARELQLLLSRRCLGRRDASQPYKLFLQKLGGSHSRLSHRPTRC